MANAAKYHFDFKEIAALLVKQLNIHEGMWMLDFNFSINAKNIAKDPNNTNVKPGLFCILEQISLTRVTSGPKDLIVDAGEVNPLVSRASARKPN